MRRLSILICALLLAVIVSAPRAQSAAGDVTLPLCSQATHDLYKATGPDGVQYPTWHPQVDLRYGCHYDHEHGSNPALFTQFAAPLFGYSAARHGMTEGNAGFKVYVFDDRHGHTWMLTNHQGTGNSVLAACTRYHTIDVAVRDNTTLALLADVHLMGDFGRAVANVAGDPSLTPVSCPNQAQVGSSTGLRKVPVTNLGDIGYGPWILDNHQLVFGMKFNALNFNTPNGQTACDTITCTANVARLDVNGTIPANGTYRFLAGGVTFSTSVYSGTFYTDPTGTAIRQASDPDSVRQFVDPSFVYTLVFQSQCRPYGSLEYPYWCLTGTGGEMPYRYNALVTGAN